MNKNDNESPIEIYLWPEGAPRPDPGKGCLDRLAVPSAGQVPQKGDTIVLGTGGSLSWYRVIERELLWTRVDSADAAAPALWSKMWIYVRKIDL